MSRVKKNAATLFKTRVFKSSLPQVVGAQVAKTSLPKISNEPLFDYAPGSSEREKLLQAIDLLKSQAPFHVNPVINGVEIESSTGNNSDNNNNNNKAQGEQPNSQVMPSEHNRVLCTFGNTSMEQLEQAVEGALLAKERWATMPLYDRQAIFLKAADLISKKYRYLLMAATMLGQGKNAWQAEIDAAAETIDFFRFNTKYSDEVYANQPPENSPGVWNHLEYRPLEGFVYAVSPFNFTAIGANLAYAPALMGNVVLWKPSKTAMLSNYILYKILEEAGMPSGVVQFIPGDPVKVTDYLFGRREFSALHFTGSTAVFRSMWRKMAENIDKYVTYPRIVGETGGKNFHLIHPSADVTNAVLQTIRAAFEYQGQKCSACSRLYVPASLWPEFKSKLVEQISLVKVGNVADFENFMGPVIDARAFAKISKYIDDAKSVDSGKCTIIAGGKYDDSTGYFIEPTVIQTTDPHYTTMKEEIFGPVLTAYVYNDNEFAQIIDTIDTTTPYSLTGSIFAADREAITYATTRLANSSGNFYINDKSTGAVVGQQPFGGARASGTNDKAGSANLLYRFVSPRSIKESFLPISTFKYPSNF